MVDGLADFAREFGCWMVPAWAFWRKDRGYPVSWRHYAYGMAHIGRATARETLRRATAVAAGHSDPQSWKTFTSDLERIAR